MIIGLFNDIHLRSTEIEVFHCTIWQNIRYL